MKNDDNIDNDSGYPWGDNSDYDSEECYGQPWDWSLTRQNSQPIEPRMQRLLAKQPVRAINANVSNFPSLA